MLERKLKTDLEKKARDFTIAALATGRSSLYESAGKRAESIAAMEAGVKKIGPDNITARSLVHKLTIAKLYGSPAPELVIDRHYGEFKDLASLRGKVVLLDFTSHG